MDCVIYSGADHTCSNITHGESISPIMMQALSLIFPLENCCYFQANAVLIDPAPQRYTFCYSYKDGNCARACECDETTTNVTVYSFDSPLVSGSILYSNSNMTILAPEGWYSANNECITVSGGNGTGVIIPGIAGTVQTVTSCTITSTTSSTTTTTTLTPCYCYRITMVATNTIDYVDCDGGEVTSPSYDNGEIVELCAESVSSSASYTIALPTQYCADRITCPTTTTSTSTSTTTTTTTLPPCNCIVWTNTGRSSSSISWRDCTGQVKTETLGGGGTASKCGSSAAASSPYSQPVIGAPCSGSGISATCSTGDNTTLPCSPYILYCCGDTTGGTSIQPCYPIISGAAFAIGNIYRDEQGRNWIVVGTSGTVTSNYFPIILSFVSAGNTLAQCQAVSQNQILCPGVTTTTTTPIVKHLKFDEDNCINACTTVTTINVYSNCAILSLNNCRLYIDSGLTTPYAVAGWVSDGTNSFSVNSNGNLQQISPCSSCTTTTSTTTTTTINPRTIQIINNVVVPLGSNNGGFPIISDVGMWSQQAGYMALAGVVWPSGSGFTAMSPNTSLTVSQTGTYSQAPSLPLALKISKTYITNTMLNPAFMGTYYIHFYKNGVLSGCCPISPLTTARDINTGFTFTTNDTIKLVLDITYDPIWC
jgi:hypothetical protein